jgi:hypothetical protein
MTRIAIDADALRQHATAMRQVAADVQEAVEAARGIDLAGGAFGIMCSFLVPPAQLASTAAISGIASSKGMLDRTADEVVEVATETEGAEAERVRALQSLQKGLD